jgi:hypothetical protein
MLQVNKADEIQIRDQIAIQLFVATQLSLDEDADLHPSWNLSTTRAMAAYEVADAFIETRRTIRKWDGGGAA